LHDNATTISWRHFEHTTPRKPCVRIPQRRYRRSSSSTKKYEVGRAGLTVDAAAANLYRRSRRRMTPTYEFVPIPGFLGGPRHVVETERRLSCSRLWTLQRSYFERRGVDAWRTAAVPEYVTNNPALASAYADVFLGFLRDALPLLAPDEPFTLVELGAGSGRFAYLFLKAFLARHRRSPLADVQIRYVMTDLAEANVAFWRTHEGLRPFLEQGVLDFAVFDVERDVELRLERAGTTLGPGDLANPLGVIANYVFDSTSQDAFWFGGGELHEHLIALSSHESTLDLDDPASIPGLIPEYHRRPARLDYYGEPALDRILRSYAATIEDATVLFPAGAIRCLDRLAALAGGRLLLLAGDREAADPGEAAAPNPLGLAVHGSFSLPVNYHAIAEHVRASGGVVLAPSSRQEHLTVMAFVLGEHAAEHHEARSAYERALDRATPLDFFTVRRGFQAHYERLEPEHLVALIRMSHHDPRVAGDCLSALAKGAEEAPEPRKREIAVTLLRAWENYYSLGEEHDLAFDFGRLLYAVAAYDEAIELFLASTRLHGGDARTAWNLGMCHYRAGRLTEAARWQAEAARQKPGFSPAGAIQTKDPPLPRR
jgi:tetratricopeptide (TPR) repeat protein